MTPEIEELLDDLETACTKAANHRPRPALWIEDDDGDQVGIMWCDEVATAVKQIRKLIA